MINKFGKIDLNSIQKQINENLNIIQKSKDMKIKLIAFQNIQEYYGILETISKHEVNIEHLLIENYVELNNLLESVEQDNLKEFVKIFKQHKYFIRTISSNIFNTNINKEIKKEDLELNPINLSTIYEFLLSYDNNSEFNKFILKEINNRKLHFDTNFQSDALKNNYNGLTCFCSPNDNYYICDKNKKTYYYNLFCIIHELSHGFVTFKSNIDLPYSFIREAIPVFNELKLNDDIYKISKKDAILHTKFYFKELFENSLSLYYWSFLIDSIDKNSIVNDDLFNKLLNKYKFDEDLIILDKDDGYFDSILYTLGPLVALHLYYQYINDPEKSEHNINYMYNNLSIMNGFTILKNIGIGKEELFDSSLLKKYDKKLLKRITK